MRDKFTTPPYMRDHAPLAPSWTRHWLRLTCYDTDVSSLAQFTGEWNLTLVPPQWRGGTTSSVETNVLLTSAHIHTLSGSFFVTHSTTVRIVELSDNIMLISTAFSVTGPTVQSIVSLSNVTHLDGGVTLVGLIAKCEFHWI